MRRALVLLVACGTRGAAPAPSPASAPGIVENALRPPAAFDAIADRTQRSRALFGEAAKVLTHARCVNCHPSDDTPRQGDRHELHDPPVVRGTANRGVPAMQCTTCHQDRNLELARVPGAPGWHLAPPSMAWLDRTPRQICEALKDPAHNGGRSLAQVQDHLAHDPLVAWGWAPGAERAPAPGSQAELGALIQAWIDSGAECPP
jgi:hypothetical protein